MLALIKRNIEKVFKEYIEYKTYFYAEIEKIKSKKKEIGESLLDIDENTHASILFEEQGWIQYAATDLAQLRLNLYFTYEAYKDMVEIPQELKETVDEELKDVSPRYLFSVKNGEREIVDKNLYEEVKKQFIYMTELQSEKFNSSE